MSHLIGFLIGLLSGIIATLVADNLYVRFHIEKALRKFFGRRLISIELTTFTNHCGDHGMFFIHCIEIKNKMWFTSTIPQVYLLYLLGGVPCHAYKPLLYFRSRSSSEIKLNSTLSQLLDEYSSKIVTYAPGEPNLTINISKSFPLRIAVLCEAIPEDKINEEIPLNHQKVLGELHAAVANPMPIVSSGSSWGISIISQDFGHIEKLDFSIPEDLENKKPLGDSTEVLEISNRPPCLLDVDYCSLTWPLRFKINGCDIKVKRNLPKKIVIRGSQNKKLNPIAGLRSLWRRRKLKKLGFKGHPSIKIQ